MEFGLEEPYKEKEELAKPESNIDSAPLIETKIPPEDNLNISSVDDDNRDSKCSLIETNIPPPNQEENKENPKIEEEIKNQNDSKEQIPYNLMNDKKKSKERNNNNSDKNNKQNVVELYILSKERKKKWEKINRKRKIISIFVLMNILTFLDIILQIIGLYNNRNLIIDDLVYILNVIFFFINKACKSCFIFEGLYYLSCLGFFVNLFIFFIKADYYTGNGLKNFFISFIIFGIKLFFILYLYYLKIFLFL